MLFSSAEFLLVFLPLAFAAFWWARKLAGVGVALGVLTAASLVYYGYRAWSDTAVFMSSMVINYAAARYLSPGRRWNRAALAVAVAANLALLFWFKYASFASGVVADLGLVHGRLAAAALPLGISFFTFQQIAFLVDRSRGLAPPLSFGRHLLFISFFPQHIAGPIVHHDQVMPQLDNPRLSPGGCALGLFILGVGLFKKSVLADPLGEFAAPGFADPASLATPMAWATVLAYTMQLYLDFSGYSDMAVGLALLFGVRLPWNFLSPYKATSIAAFWRRWHVTLSNFLKDYVYIPLGGSRRGPARTAINLLITMLLGGIWHGAGWTFMLWGLLHGAALVANHLVRPLRLPVPAVAGWAATMFVVVMGWVLFRAASLSDARAMYARLFAAGEAPRVDPSSPALHIALPYLIVAVVITLACPNAATLAARFRPTPLWTLWGAAMILCAMVFILGHVRPPEFLYFAF